jgi:hypothetical protein
MDNGVRTYSNAKKVRNTFKRVEWITDLVLPHHVHRPSRILRQSLRWLIFLRSCQLNVGRDEDISGVQYEGDMELRILDQASWVGRDDGQRQGHRSSALNHGRRSGPESMPAL